MIQIIDEDDGMRKLLKSFRTGTKTVAVGVLTNDSKIQGIAAANEFGATIEPKGRKWLTIPLRSELKGKKATDFKLEFIPPSNGKKFAMLVKRIGKEVIPYYLLLKKVVIPERAFLRSTVDNSKYLRLIEKRTESILQSFLDGEKTLQDYLLSVGLSLESIIRERILNNEFEKNSPITVNMKGTGKPALVDTRKLLQSIESRVES